jgi:hypothetical protein
MATLALGDLPQENLISVSSSTFDASPLTVLVCNTSSNGIVVTLPDATSVPSGIGLKVFLEVATDDVTFATVAPYGSDTAQTINGLPASSFNSSYKLTAAATSLQFISNGSNWLASAGSL